MIGIAVIDLLRGVSVSEQTETGRRRLRIGGLMLTRIAHLQMFKRYVTIMSVVGIFVLRTTYGFFDESSYNVILNIKGKEELSICLILGDWGSEGFQPFLPLSRG
jgi:hypothetical protein